MTQNQAPASGSEFMSSIVGGIRLWGACQACTPQSISAHNEIMQSHAGSVQVI